MKKLAILGFLFSAILFAENSNVSTLMNSQEGVGGNPDVPTVKRMGHYLADHVENENADILREMENYEKFRKTIFRVPILFVSKFPKTITDKYGDTLIGATVKDSTSPTGTTILLHKERFNAAYKEFVAGKTTTTFKIVRTVVKSETFGYYPERTKTKKKTTEIVEENPAFEIFEGSFLVFILHEFLLAAGEKDINNEISTLLFGATLAKFKTWLKDPKRTRPTYLTVWLPASIGDLKNGEAAKREARKAWLKYWEETGADIEQEMEKKILAAFKAHDIRPIATTTKKGSDEAFTIDAAMPANNWGSRTYAVFLYGKRQAALEFKLAPSETPIRAIPLDDFKIGAAFDYDEISTGRINYENARKAYENARFYYLDEYEKQMDAAEKLGRSLYRDRFLFVGPGEIRFGASRASFWRPNSIRYTFTDASTGRQKSMEGMPGTKTFMASTPVIYILDK